MTTRRNFLAVSAAFAAFSPLSLTAQSMSRGGQFKGQSDHKAAGTVQLVEKDGKLQVEMLSDFKFDGAPDAKVALGRNGYDKSTILGPLEKNNGAQIYMIPANIDTAGVNEVWIWCEQYDVPLGMAQIR